MLTLGVSLQTWSYLDITFLLICTFEIHISCLVANFTFWKFECYEINKKSVGTSLNKLKRPTLAWPQTIRPNWHSNKGFTSKIVKLSNHNTNFVRDLVGLIVISDPCFSLGKCKHRVYFQFYQVFRAVHKLRWHYFED